MGRRWREPGIITPHEREVAMMRKVTAWLALPLSERIRRKESYRWQLAFSLAYSRSSSLSTSPVTPTTGKLLTPSKPPPESASKSLGPSSS